VLMTDGADTASTRTSFTDAINLAKRNNIVFYTIAMGPDLNSSELHDLAEQTGGLFFAADGADIGEKFKDVLSNIQYFYEISTTFEENTTANYRVDVLLDGETISGFAEHNSTIIPPDVPIDPENPNNGPSLYTKCIACHGTDGQTSAYNVTLRISSLTAAAIEERLLGYKSGALNLYGYGELMHDQISTYSDEQITTVSEYIATLNN